jgi:hypothetical protein
MTPGSFLKKPLLVPKSDTGRLFGPTSETFTLLLVAAIMYINDRYHEEGGS